MIIRLQDRVQLSISSTRHNFTS